MDGGSPEGAAGLVMAHLRLKDPESALRALGALAPVLGGRAAGAMLRADALEAQGKTAEAAAARGAAPEPADALDFHLLAERELQAAEKSLLTDEKGDLAAFQRAVRLTTQALVRSSGPRLLLLELRAHAALHAKDREVAQDVASVLKARWPNAASAHLWRGRALWMNKDPGLFEEATVAFREAIRLRPDGPQAYYALGGILHDCGRLDQAIASVRDALKLKPDYVSALTSLGRMLADRQEFDAAEAACRQALQLRPEDSTAHLNLAVALHGKGLIDEAVRVAEETIRIAPRYADGHLNLGVYLHSQGRIDEAIAAYRRARAIDPSVPQIHLNLGAALAVEGRSDEALGSFREAVRLGPGHLDANLNLSRHLNACGRPQEALAVSRAMVRLHPKEADAWHELGRALGSTGATVEAIAAFRETVSLDPDAAVAHVNLGMALYDEGKFKEALEELRRGKALGAQLPHGSPSCDELIIQCEDLAQMEERLLRVAAGEEASRGPEDLVLLAGLATRTGRHALAVRWYRRILEPGAALEAVAPTHTWLAARAAVLASTEPVAEDGSPTEVDRTGFRRQALSWAKDALRSHRTLVSEGKLREERLAAMAVRWLSDRAFAAVREPAVLTTLPEDKARAWSASWQELSELAE